MSITMRPTIFHLNTVQSVNLDSARDTIIFETQCVTSSTYYFTLTREQFFAFDDALYMIERGNMQGHFPLGQDIYFSYHNDRRGHERRLIKRRRQDRPDITFDFVAFTDYIKSVHHRIISFLRWGDQATRRKQRRRHRAKKDRSISSSRKRSLPDGCESASESTTTGKTCDGKITPGPSDNALMSPALETSTIFPERSSSNYGRRTDSTLIETTISHDLQSPERIQLIDCEESNEMEMY